MKNLKPTYRRCICRGCCESFNSVGAFDMHRTGNHATDRRCMSPGEMYERGMRENADGYWVTQLMPSDVR